MNIDINDESQRKVLLQIAAAIKDLDRSESNAAKTEYNWEFSKPEKKDKVDSKRIDSGVFAFKEMQGNSTKNTSKRESRVWRASCKYWLRYFKTLEQPVVIMYSKRGEPQPWTVHVREANSESSEITKVVGNNINERTFAYRYIYEIKVPPESLRKSGKEMMNKIWGLPKDDTIEFLKFRDEVCQITKEVKTNHLDENHGYVYERQLEYHYNMLGYHVIMHGVKKKYSDEGVDLILVKNGKTYLVQAKAYTRQHSLSISDVEIIYNKMVDFKDKYKSTDLILGSIDKIILTTLTDNVLNREAKESAENLGLRVDIVPYEDSWTKFKCVPGKNNIYYGPKDSHYCKVEMLSDKRRFWAHSEEEAQGKGFKKPRMRKISKLITTL